MNPLISIRYFILLAVPVVGFATMVAWRSTQRAPRTLRIAMTVSRLLAVCGVLALLLNIGYKHPLSRELHSSWAVMVDRSASMAYRDVNGASRWEAAVETATSAVRSASHPEKAHLYTFANVADSRTLEDLAAVLPDGTDTRLNEAGKTVLAREKTTGGKLRGILLLSDGRQPDGAPPDDFALLAAARSAPVFPIVLGGKVPRKDIEIRLPQLRHVGFAGQPVVIGGTLINQRMGKLQTTVALRDADGRVVEKRSLFSEDGQEVPFRFEVNRNAPGYYEYRLETPPRPDESKRGNNMAGVGVFVLAKRLKVLLLEGEPYWDTKFLAHMMRAQSSIAMSAVFRVTRDRFFKVTTDAAMTAANADAFPKTAEELGKFDLVVVGRGSEYFVDAKRARLLADFVKNRGGCLLFARGKSYAGPASDLQPLEPVQWGKPIETDFTLRPRLSGEQAGLFGGLLPAPGAPLWQELPALTQAHECLKLRSFASVLAEGVPQSSRQGTFPLLVSKRYGNGLVLLVNGDGLWKWGFFPEIADKNDVYQDLWLRLFQWAVSFARFSPGSNYFITTDQRTVPIGQSVRIRVHARAQAESQSFVVGVYRQSERIQTLALAENSDRSAGWSGLLNLSSPGIFRLAVESKGEGSDLGAQTTLRVLAPPTETDNLSSDTAFLNLLAERSGGSVITPEAVPEIVAGFESSESAQREGNVIWKRLWDKTGVMLALMLFLALEWYWRRRQGLG